MTDQSASESSTPIVGWRKDLENGLITVLVIDYCGEVLFPIHPEVKVEEILTQGTDELLDAVLETTYPNFDPKQDHQKIEELKIKAINKWLASYHGLTSPDPESPSGGFYLLTGKLEHLTETATQWIIRLENYGPGQDDHGDYFYSSALGLGHLCEALGLKDAYNEFIDFAEQEAEESGDEDPMIPERL